jgi:hypothetical protein
MKSTRLDGELSDATNAERWINIELASQPDYKKLRVLSKQTAIQYSPFIAGRMSGGEPGQLTDLNYARLKRIRQCSGIRAWAR